MSVDASEGIPNYPAQTAYIKDHALDTKTFGGGSETREVLDRGSGRRDGSSNGRGSHGGNEVKL